MTEASKQVHQEISDWLGDVVALESHVEEAMDGQLKIESKNHELTKTLQHFHDTVRDSKQRAEAFQEEYGSTSGNPVIEVGSNLLGKAAGMIGKIRNDSVSKAMRDDYTAFNLLSMAYTMLNTTALALADEKTAAFARQGLTTYAGLVQELNHMMPVAVVQDIRDGDHAPTMASNVVDEARKVIDGAWTTTSL